MSVLESSAMTIALRNARLVLHNDVVCGSLVMEGAYIRSIDGGSASIGIDLEGDYLVPGLVDIHTDNVEKHFLPRPSVHWPSATAAVLAHDWQMFGAGITTVLDAVSIGDLETNGTRSEILSGIVNAVSDAKEAGILRADHFLHFRCELSDPAMISIAEHLVCHPDLRLISAMDHTPGQRQWRDLAIYREYRKKKTAKVWSDAEFIEYLESRRHLQRQFVPRGREWVSSAALACRIRLASHDDTTSEDVLTAATGGTTISEFPTTHEAARQARDLGMTIVMGAPNIVLGGSHSGNVGAGDLASDGLLDILTSDYVPSSLLHAPFLMAKCGMPLHQAIAMVTEKPADAVGFQDRGRIQLNCRADLLRVRIVNDVPVIRNIWIAGKQVL